MSNRSRRHPGPVRTRTRGWFLALWLVALLTLVGCADQTPARPDGSPSDPGRPVGGDPAALQGQWVAERAEGIELLPGVEVVVGFAENRISANAGCNGMGAAFTATPTQLRTDPLTSTRMFCPDRMDQEKWVADLLQAEPTWQVRAEKLELRAGDRALHLRHR